MKVLHPIFRGCFFSVCLLGATVTAQAQSTFSQASAAVSMIPVAMAYSTASVLGANPIEASAAGSHVGAEMVSAFLTDGSKFVVTGVKASALGTSYVLERASDGAKVSVDVSGNVLSASGNMIGSVVKSTVISTGVILESAGEMLAYIPNAAGRALLHNERVL